MDIDYAIHKDEPLAITETSHKNDIDKYEKWEWSNRLCVIFIKIKILASIHGSLKQYDNVRALIKSIDEHFASSNKALASTLIMKFLST